MKTGKTALVIEGGGLRGVFAAGVLEAFLELGVSFDSVYGVSAGATSAVTYLAGQKGRNRRVFIDYNDDPNYMGLRSYLRTGNYFNKEFIFEKIPNELDPFDYQAFNQRVSSFALPVTNARTGKTELITDFSTATQLTSALKAATALPMMAKPEPLGREHYFDGGISCPLIWDQIDLSAYALVVYVLTQPAGYRKQPSKHPLLARVLLKRYPAIVEALKVRHQVYNSTLERISQAERAVSHLRVIRPDGAIRVKRTEKDKRKLLKSFDHGYQTGLEFLQSDDLGCQLKLSNINEIKESP